MQVLTEIKSLTIVVVDIPTQICLTLLQFIDRYLCRKLKVYITTHPKEKPSTNWYVLQH